MLELLLDPLLPTRFSDGTTEALSLPDVYEAMVGDRVSSFPSLRPHQRHAWHAFLAQLGAMAVHRAGLDTPPASAAEWRALLRGLTPDFEHDEPWRLVVEDHAQPAFLQCPSPAGLSEFRRRVSSPDDLDILVTSKNHDVKRSIAAAGTPADWVFALISIQTTGPFLGAGNYGVARMNGGFSSRPCVGLAPLEGGPGGHWYRDLSAMLAHRAALIRRYPRHFRRVGGRALLWLEPWTGAEALPLQHLDPYFIEICRRVRLVGTPGQLSAITAASKTPRLAAKAAKGDLGDFWTPVDRTDAKALSFSPSTTHYENLVHLLFGDAFTLPPALSTRDELRDGARLVVRGLAGGKGLTEGYHERTDVTFAPTTLSAFLNPSTRAELAELAKAQIAEIDEVKHALRFAIAIAASGGKPAEELRKSDRQQTGPYSRRLDRVADARFFEALQKRFQAPGGEARANTRTRFIREMIEAGQTLLDEAVESVPCAAVFRHRASVHAAKAYWGLLRRPEGVFADQRDALVDKEGHIVPDHREHGADIRYADNIPTPSVEEQIARIAERIAKLEPRAAAALRREPRSGAGAATFRHIMVRHAPESLARDEVGWAAVLQAIAILTPKGREGERPSAHHPAVSMGAALRAAGITELRLAGLLNAPRPWRAGRVVRLCRRLARTGQRRFDLGTLARFILSGSEDTTRRIAREYYFPRHSSATREPTGTDP